MYIQYIRNLGKFVQNCVKLNFWLGSAFDTRIANLIKSVNKQMLKFSVLLANFE